MGGLEEAPDSESDPASVSRLHEQAYRMIADLRALLFAKGERP